MMNAKKAGMLRVNGFYALLVLYAFALKGRAYVLFVLVYRLRQEVGYGVEDGGLEQGRCQWRWRHVDSGNIT